MGILHIKQSENNSNALLLVLLVKSINALDNHNRHKCCHNNLPFHLPLHFHILHISSLADF